MYSQNSFANELNYNPLQKKLDPRKIVALDIRLC